MIECQRLVGLSCLYYSLVFEPFSLRAERATEGQGRHHFSNSPFCFSLASLSSATARIYETGELEPMQYETSPLQARANGDLRSETPSTFSFNPLSLFSLTVQSTMSAAEGKMEYWQHPLDQSTHQHPLSRTNDRRIRPFQGRAPSRALLVRRP